MELKKETSEGDEKSLLALDDDGGVKKLQALFSSSAIHSPGSVGAFMAAHRPSRSTPISTAPALPSLAQGSLVFQKVNRDLSSIQNILTPGVVVNEPFAAILYPPLEKVLAVPQDELKDEELDITLGFLEYMQYCFQDSGAAETLFMLYLCYISSVYY